MYEIQIEKLVITKVSLNKSIVELKNGKSLIWKVTVTPSDASNQTVTCQSRSGSTNEIEGAKECTEMELT